MPTAPRPVSSPSSSEDPKSGVRKATIQGGLAASPAIPPAPPAPKSIPNDLPSRSGRAAVRPRPSARTTAPPKTPAPPAPAPAAVVPAPVAPKPGLFRSLTTTREDWPIAPTPTNDLPPPVSSAPPAPSAEQREESSERRSDSQPPPTFGRHPRKGTLDPARQSLPAFRPPSLMIPVAPGPITIQAANDAEASPIPLPKIALPSVLEPVSSDIAFDDLPGSSLDHLPTGVQNRRLGSVVLFAVGVGTGVLLTLLAQALT